MRIGFAGFNREGSGVVPTSRNQNGHAGLAGSRYHYKGRDNA